MDLTWDGIAEIEVLKSMQVDDTLIEFVHNHHCEHYELQIDGIPVFYSNDMEHVAYEYEMEKE
tara:strand:- start:1124 stop:1312 length:189 start_codon:yes stop_codon:yes gene_type:complete